MKKYVLITILGIVLGVTSCASVSVSTDYDKQVNFSGYQTFAFLKEGIDRAQISDLDKKRILRAIEQNLTSKGLKIAENPDFLVTIFTKEQENVSVYNNPNVHLGLGWGPFWGGTSYQARKTTEGVLFIEIIDAQKKELVWQGKGVGYIPENQEDKEKAITNFVTKILEKYPPVKK